MTREERDWAESVVELGRLARDHAVECPSCHGKVYCFRCGVLRSLGDTIERLGIDLLLAGTPAADTIETHYGAEE
ncbi:MAG: hypothetical protein H0U85_00045 [Gemmatimonadales bacterium]|nr:hypothetical protein [Gemmatimonadales bacterium]